MNDYVLSAELTLKDKFTAKIKEATKASEKFKNAFEKIDAKLKHFGETHKLDSFVNKIDTVSKKINKLTVNALKIGAVGGIGMLAGASKIGADFEALGARMDTAFQGNKQKAAEYYKWANKFANQTPFENEEVIDAVVRLKSYGYEDPRRLMTILGDMAGAYGKTLEQSVEAYADASRGEFERLKEFGIQKDEVLNYAKEIMGKEVKMSGEKVKDMDTFMKALERLIKSRSKDGMKHLANTLSGMLSTTKGLLKYNIAKLVGLTDEGHIRAGSLIDRIKEKLENFNNYMQSEEGQKAMNDWANAFTNALPQIIKIANSIKDKFKEIAGENFMEKLNESIKKFDPKSFNKALDNIQKRMEKMTEWGMRLGGVFVGMQLAKINPYLGILAMGAGAFSPEIIEAAKKAMEYDEHRKQLVEEAEKKKEKAPTYISGASEELNQYLDDYLKGKTQNTGVEFYFGGEAKKTEHSIKLEVDFKGTENLSKEQMEKIAQETVQKTFSILTDEIEFA